MQIFGCRFFPFDIQTRFYFNKIGTQIENNFTSKRKYTIFCLVFSFLDYIWQCLGLVPGSVFNHLSWSGPYGILGIETKLDICKTNTLPSIV